MHTFADVCDLYASSSRGRASHTRPATDQNMRCDASSAPIAPAPHLEGEPYTLTSAPTDTECTSHVPDAATFLLAPPVLDMIKRSTLKLRPPISLKSSPELDLAS